MRSFALSIFGLYILGLPVSAQELSSILEAHYKAASQAKMGQVESLITTGRNSFKSAGFELNFRIVQARPDKLRVEENYPGSEVIQTYDGTMAWKYAPTMGIPEPVRINGEELKTLLSQAQFEDPLWNYEEKGAKIQLLESDRAGNHLLRYTGADGQELHIYLDGDKFLISAIIIKQVLRGSETETEVRLEDYKKIKGIPFARRITTLMNGQVLTVVSIEKVEINPSLDPGLFEKPVKE